MPTGPDFVTPGEAVTAIQAYFELLTADRAEFKDWASGEADGGPNDDGKYPLTDFTGNVQLIDCPAKIAATVGSAMALSSTKGFTDWDDLKDLNATTGNVIALVQGDAGTHIDPVTDATVPNSGFFKFDVTDSGWTFLFSLPPIMDDDGTLAANSDDRVATQKATKTFVNDKLKGTWKVLGGIDCSDDPMFPAALKGDTYVVTEEGHIGGVLGQFVIVGALLVARIDNAGGNLGTAGPDWYIIGNASGFGSGGGGVAGPSVVTTQAGNYLLDAQDVGKYFRMTEAGPKTVTVRPNGTMAIAINEEFHFYNSGAGDLTILEGAGVTVRPPAGGSLVVPQHGVFTLKKVDTDSWDMMGASLAEDSFPALTGNAEKVLAVKADASGVEWITMEAGTSYTDEEARDAIGAALTEGTAIDIVVSDGSDTITINVVLDTDSTMAANSDTVIPSQKAVKAAIAAAVGGGGGGGGSPLIFSEFGDVSNGATTGSGVSVHSFNVPAGTLTKVGDFLEITANYHWIVSSSGTKGIFYSVGGASSFGYSTSSSGGHQFMRTFIVAYLTDTTFRIYEQGIADLNAAFGTSAAPSWQFGREVDQTMVSGSWSAGLTITPAVQANTTNTTFCSLHVVKAYVA